MGSLFRESKFRCLSSSGPATPPPPPKEPDFGEMPADFFSNQRPPHAPSFTEGFGKEHSLAAGMKFEEPLLSPSPASLARKKAAGADLSPRTMGDKLHAADMTKTSITGFGSNMFVTNGLVLHGSVMAFPSSVHYSCEFRTFFFKNCCLYQMLMFAPKTWEEVTPESLMILKVLTPACQLLLFGTGEVALPSQQESEL